MKSNTARKTPTASQAKTTGANRKAKRAANKKLKVVSSESGSTEDHASSVDSLESNQVHLGQAKIEEEMGQTESSQGAQEPQAETGSAAKKWWQRALENARK